MNPWLNLANARKIAAELQVKYCGEHCRTSLDPLEDDILTELWEHDLYDPEMWLEVHWDDDDCVTWIQIGTQAGLVPR